jgi:hypothetical protein
MKRSVKKTRRSPKRRSPKRRYRMNGGQQVTVKPMFGDEFVIDLPANATVNDLRERVDALNPVPSDSFNQLFVQNQNGDAVVLSMNNPQLSAYGNEIHLTVSPKAFVVKEIKWGVFRAWHGPFRTEEEALLTALKISNENIRFIRRNPQPYMNEDYLNLRNVQIDDNFVPQTRQQLEDRLNQMGVSRFLNFIFLRAPLKGSDVCMCNNVH